MTSLTHLPYLVAATQPSVYTVEMGDRVGAAFGVPHGYLVTALHTVGSASKVGLVDYKGVPHDGVIVAKDEYLDLALMFTDERPTPLALVEERPMTGEFVLAFGSPAGLDHTVSAGIVSHPNRNVKGSALITWSMTGLIQHDAFTAKGSSGGPLVDLAGNVIGMLHSGVPGVPGPGFAIPAKLIAEFVEAINRDGFVAHAYLGVQPQRNPDTAPGVRILDTDSGGLVALSRLTMLDDEHVHSAEELVAALLRRRPGDKVLVRGTWANGTLAQQTMVLGDHNYGTRGFV